MSDKVEATWHPGSAPDSTPTRTAAEALCTADTSYWHHEQTDDYPCSSCVEKANTALSAALTNDADPDWLARTLREHGETIVYSRLRCRCGWTLPSRGYAAGEARAVFSKHVADAVRAAILGEA